ncbi:MAG: RNA polymerase sigma factor [Myxococcota bacterium]
MAAHSVMEKDGSPEEWLADHGAGAPNAFERVVAHFEEPIHRYLTRCGIGSADREDLAQEIFVRIHRHAHRYQPARPAAVWVFTIVANCARSYFRHRAVRARRPPATLIPLPSPPDAPPAQSEGYETAGILQKALEELTLVQREVVLLSALQAMSIAAIAETLGLPRGTVKTHLHRSRLILAKALARSDARQRREQR